MMKRVILLIAIIFVYSLLFIVPPSCVKEYSYEGKPVDSATDTIPKPDPTDTLSKNTVYYQCPLCEENPDYILGKWSFAIDTVTFCGNITGAVMLGERTAFTFFGPSACSTDSGLIITCYLDNPFDTVAQYVMVNHVTLRYYNHLGIKDMLSADVSLGFNLTILNYSKNTGIMEGFFNGMVTTDKNDITQIKNGKFELQF